MTALLHDLRHALRTLRKSPGFTAVAVITLALGIGINTMMFSGASATLFSRLPYRAPDELVALYETRPAQHVDDGAISYTEFLDWRAQRSVFSDVAAYTQRYFNISRGSEPVGVDGEAVSVNTFRLLGVQPVLGRTFTTDDGERGHDDVVLLSDAVWRARFGADSSIIGRTIVVDGIPRTVIGVMPPRFGFPEWQEIWVPLTKPADTVARTAHNLRVLARLAPGVTLEQAQTAVSSIAHHVEARAETMGDRDASARVVSYREKLARRDVRMVIALMQAAVGFVLLIACANVASLLLARATVREREIAIRVALGASRWRIVQQLLLESVLIAIVAGGLGVLIASWANAWVWASIPAQVPFYISWTIDRGVLAFTFVISLATGVLFGLIPALQASRPDVQATLQDAARGSTGGGTRHRTRRVLVAGEIALSLVLLIGATLLIRSFVAMTAVNVGFDSTHLLTAQLHLVGDRYASPARRIALLDQVTHQLQSLPGVQQAAATDYVPLRGVARSTRFEAEGHAVPSGAEPTALFRPVTARYFDALRVPLVRGRAFAAQEVADTSAHVVIINETLARRYFPEHSVLGGRIRLSGGTDAPLLTIVGIAPDIKQGWIGERARSEIYLPYAQAAGTTVTLMARTAGDPAQLTDALRRAVHDVDPSLALFDVRTMQSVVDLSFWKPRLYGAMFGAYAMIALVLAAVGVYGMMAYAVSQRVHEIGVRVALGAQPRDVMRLVLGQSLAVTLVGVVVGIGGALAVTRLLASLLFGITSTDLLTFAGVPCLLAGVALVASYLPARRATRVDPVVALRSE